MVQIYRKTKHSDQLKEITQYQAGSWVEMTTPSKREISFVAKRLSIPREFIEAALDEEERSRVDIEEDLVLIILRIPFWSEEENRFGTVPLGVILTPSISITVCLRDTPVLSDFRTNKVKTFYTTMKTRFFLQLFQRITAYYVRYIDQVDYTVDQTERRLLTTFHNREVINLLQLQKSLVYFRTALLANGNVLERILKGEIIKLYDEDQELLHDIMVENKQALESVSIYSDILSSTMDAYASIISNNLNVVMKFLTTVTILLSIPTIVSSYYGMNVSLPFQYQPWAFIAVLFITAFLMGLALVLFYKKDLL